MVCKVKSTIDAPEKQGQIMASAGIDCCATVCQYK